jgi:GT2 family glycosyltransferase
MKSLAVVIPAVNSLGDLLGCLAALAGERADAELEVLVVNRLGEAAAAAIRTEAPWVRILPVSPATAIPQMRALAFREAKSDAIAVIEDHVIVPRGWASRLLAGLAEGHVVVGGAVENAATATLLDWAAFLCEYSHCLPPLPAGEAEWLTGNNVAYRREAVLRHLALLDAGHWENALHDALRADGAPLWCDPSLVIGHKKHYTFFEYFSQRYLYARSYAGARVAEASAAKKLAMGAAAFALPPLLFARTVQRILAKGAHTEKLWPSLPLIALFVLAWGWGEVVGYWLGPGDALAKVK